MEAESPMWHFQAKPGNEILIGILYCENDGRSIKEVRSGTALGEQHLKTHKNPDL
jgi:hypothetical protein